MPKSAMKKPSADDAIKKLQDKAQAAKATAAKANVSAPSTTDVKDYAPVNTAPKKKKVPRRFAKTDEDGGQDMYKIITVTNPDGTETKKKKKIKKKASPEYNLAGALSRGEDVAVPGRPEKTQQLPKPNVSRVQNLPNSAPQAPARPARIEQPQPEEIQPAYEPPPTPQAAPKKAAPKKEKTYHPDANIPTQQILAQRKQQEMLGEQKKQRQGGQGVAGAVGNAGKGALNKAGNAGQQGILTIGDIGKGLPVAGGAVDGATKGASNTLGAATGGVGKTLGDTTGALGRGDVGGTLGGATQGLGNTVGGVGKGLVRFPTSLPMSSFILLRIIKFCWD